MRSSIRHARWQVSADGDRVLEIGCGTGQLTRSLLARGLRVTALEPGDQLIRIAEENLKDAGDVEFVHARLEDIAAAPRELRGGVLGVRNPLG